MRPEGHQREHPHLEAGRRGHPHLFNYITRLLFVWEGAGFGQRVCATGRQMLLYLVVVVKITDVGAYGVGRTLGRHKLFPRISPAKTTGRATAYWTGTMSKVLACRTSVWDTAASSSGSWANRSWMMVCFFASSCSRGTTS